MYRDNPLKAKLRGGGAALGTWLLGGWPVAAEILALAGYDCVVMDHEHGFAGLGETVGCLQALSGTATAGVVRVPWNEPVHVKRVLDLGVDGIMVPCVGSAEEARAAVAACRYPPDGIRGAAYGSSRASSYGLARDRYLGTVHDNLLILCQIETARGVEAIPEIAAVDGVDMLFVGPYDLSGNLGRLGRFDDPEVRKVIRGAECAIKATGKWLGSIPSLGRTPADMAADGVDLVVAGAELQFLRDGACAALAAFRAATGRGAPDQIAPGQIAEGQCE